MIRYSAYSPKHAWCASYIGVELREDVSSGDFRFRGGVEVSDVPLGRIVLLFAF